MKGKRVQTLRCGMLFMALVMLNTLAGAEVDIFIPSFPQLQAHFGLTPFGVQLTLSLNFIAYALSTLCIGALGDRICRRKVILASLAIFNVGSVLCVFAPNFISILIGRVLQGAGVASCAILSFVIITDVFAARKQPGLLGLFNGILNLSMAVAPVVGAYINLYFGWRANFMVLLGLGILSFAAAWIFLPRTKVVGSTPLGFAAYAPVLRSKTYIRLMLAIGSANCAYWIFVGMAPIVYMEGLGVTLQAFGFYQGAIVLPYALISLLSPKFMRWMGAVHSYRVGIGLITLGMLYMLALVIMGCSTPKAITTAMVIIIAGTVLPMNFLYRAALFAVKGAKSRAAAGLSAFRLIFTAIALEAVSYLYTGSYTPVGIAVLGCLFIFMALVATYKPSLVPLKEAQLEHLQ